MTSFFVPFLVIYAVLLVLILLAALELRHLVSIVNQFYHDKLDVKIPLRTIVKFAVLSLVPVLHLGPLVMINTLNRVIIINYGQRLWNQLYPSERVTYKIASWMRGKYITEIIQIQNL